MGAVRGERPGVRMWEARLPLQVTRLLRLFSSMWRQLSLSGQFLAAGAVVLLLGMLVIAIWVTQQIEDGVIRNSASATALYVDSVISPLFGNIGDVGVLSPGAARALDETLAQGTFGKRLVVFKLWRRDSSVAYATDATLIGKKFAATDNLKEAWAGRVAAEFNHLGDDENLAERGLAAPLLEIYSPVRQPWTGEIIAVAEFYEEASELEAGLGAARIRSWLIVSLVTTAMLAMLYGIVHRGSVMISQQRSALEERVSELSQLLEQNRNLRESVIAASNRSVAINEQYLRRISADLHDGPAQLLALALMRLGSLAHASPPNTESGTEFVRVRRFLDDAMREIRNICRGLALPQIEAMALNEILRSAVATHEERSGNTVALTLPHGTMHLDASAKICIYRFVQESLNNASRHAGGQGLAVAAMITAGGLTTTVDDRGPGFDPGEIAAGLGLHGLRQRIESLGGTFELSSSPTGTRLACILPQTARKLLA